MKSKIAGLIATAALAILLVGCGSTSSPTAQAPPPRPEQPAIDPDGDRPAGPRHRFDGRYRLVAWDGSAYEPRRGGDLTLTIDGRQVAGKGPVNRFTTRHTGGAIGQIAATRMAGPPHLMRRESKYFDLLRGGQLQRARNGDLLVKDGQRIRLRFRRD